MRLFYAAISVFYGVVNAITLINGKSITDINLLMMWVMIIMTSLEEIKEKQ